MIRTGVVRDGRLSFQAGGGILIDSDADEEYDECLKKTAIIKWLSTKH